MNIETKYSVDDAVYVGRAEWGSEPIPCPDCKGTGKWTVVANSGPSGFWETTCQTCRDWGNYSGYGTGKVKQSTRIAITEYRTIGSIQVDTNGDVVRYMCVETGVGSGSIYYEKDLFPTREEALAHAETLVAEQLPEARNKDEAHRDRMRTEEVHHCTRRDSATDKLTVHAEQRSKGCWDAWIPGVASVGPYKSQLKAVSALAIEIAEQKL